MRSVGTVVVVDADGFAGTEVEGLDRGGSLELYRGLDDVFEVVPFAGGGAATVPLCCVLLAAAVEVEAYRPLTPCRFSMYVSSHAERCRL